MNTKDIAALTDQELVNMHTALETKYNQNKVVDLRLLKKLDAEMVKRFS